MTKKQVEKYIEKVKAIVGDDKNVLRIKVEYDVRSDESGIEEQYWICVFYKNTDTDPMLMADSGFGLTLAQAYGNFVNDYKKNH